jgi:hypothetical protein
MNRFRAVSIEYFGCAFVGLLISNAVSYGGVPTTSGGTAPDTGTGSSQPAKMAAPLPLSADDVSWLFPPPARSADLSGLISMSELIAQNPADPTNGGPVWLPAVFHQLIAIAASPAAQVAGTTNHIGLPAEVQSIDAWFIAGIRIDAGAPGLSDDIRSQFGQSPEIRLIVQPVTRNSDGSVTVHDIAVHLIFGFTAGFNAPAQPGCLPRAIPDLVALRSIVADLAMLRTKLNAGQLGSNKVVTSGVPLGVYPGLVDSTTASNVRQEMRAFLERHLSSQRLDAMSIMGVPTGAPGPWMFLAMLRVGPGIDPSLPNGGYVPVPGPTLDGLQFTEMLNFAGTNPRVVPAPHTNNLNPITCANNAANPTAGPPIAGRSGSATADVFGAALPQPSDIRKILDLIANPNRSHFFNTDCVSCHTETRRDIDLLQTTAFPGLDPAVLPNGQWNVRNFGWSPPIEGPVRATATRRTAAETAAVVTFINAELLGRQ